MKDSANFKMNANAANNQAAIWTTGSKRNANSKAGRFRARKRAKLMASERVMQC
jgi:hypothetical protein